MNPASSSGARRTDYREDMERLNDYKKESERQNPKPKTRAAVKQDQYNEKLAGQQSPKDEMLAAPKIPSPQGIPSVKPDLDAFNDKVADIRGLIATTKEEINKDERRLLSKSEPLNATQRTNIGKRIIQNQREMAAKQAALDELLKASPKKASPKKGQVGLGGGLYTDQIMKCMSRVPSFIGCVAADEFPKLLARIKPHTKIGFISNLDPSTKSGSHWVAIVLNGTDKGPDAHSVMYFDPFGEDLPANMQKSLDSLAEKIDPDTLPKLKVNRVQHQNQSTDNCGYFGMNFCLDILARNKSFADASGFKDKIEDKSGKYEKEIEQLKKSGPFAYCMKGGSDAETAAEIDRPIPHPPVIAPHAEAPKAEVPKAEPKQDTASRVVAVADKVNDGLDTIAKVAAVIPAPRNKFPPAVRKFMEEHKDDEIVSSTVCKTPIFGIIQKTINILRKITFRKANPTYDKLFHLFIFMQLKSPDGKTSNIRMDRNQTFELKPGQPDKKGDCKPVGKFNGKFGDIFEKAIKANKENFFVYDAVNNNCQDMVISVLKAGGVATAELSKFVKQDVKQLLPAFITNGAKKVTDLAHGVDVLINGEGAKNKMLPKVINK
jgi:hypothetical protein